MHPQTRKRSGFLRLGQILSHIGDLHEDRIMVCRLKQFLS